MYVSVNEVITNEKKKTITINATNLEDALCFDRFDDDMSSFNVSFIFRSGEEYQNELKYLYKLISSQAACRAESTMRGKLNALVGANLYISENFIK